MTVTESVIRDKLSINLELLEPGLTLLEIEKYLPNRQGTRGFVDLLAKDSRGRYVLIELKRSDTSSREAIHEVLKYVEGIKTNLALKDDELRIFIVSTHWTELLVPFSAFVHRTSLSTTGFLLNVTTNGTPLTATNVDVLPLTQERLFTPWHEVSLYTSLKSLERGIASHEAVCLKKGFSNYVLLILEPHSEHRNNEIASVQAAMNSMRSQFGEAPLSIEEVAEKLPHHKHMLYFATLQLDEAVALTAIESIMSTADMSENFEEFLSSIEDLEGEELSGTLQEKLLEAEPWPHRDYLEISYPARFTKILDEEKWEISSIRRYGTIHSNSLLKDHAIVSELRGEQGVTGQRYVKELMGGSLSDLTIVKSEVSKCLEDNPIWKSHLSIGIQELSSLSPTTPTKISVLNPSNIFLSLYLFLAKKDGILYIPNYSITTDDGSTTQMIFGHLAGTGKTPSMRKIIEDYYDNDPYHMLLPLSWGGYESRDAVIMRDIGLTYKTYKVVIEGDERAFSQLTELGWETCAPVRFLQGLYDYIDQNEEFISDIVEFFSSHWNGFMITHERDESVEFHT